MGGFFSALFGGSNPTLNKTINQLGDLSGYSQNIGQGDTTQASNYFRNLLGDPAAQAKALAPEISGQQQQIQQANNALAQFGTRSGGTGAAQVAAPAQARGNIINLLGNLQGGAARSLAGLGTTNLGLAQNANAERAQQSQERMKNYMQSILGQGISTGIGTLEGMGLGTLGAPSAASVANPYATIGQAASPSTYAGLSPETYNPTGPQVF